MGSHSSAGTLASRMIRHSSAKQGRRDLLLILLNCSLVNTTLRSHQIKLNTWFSSKRMQIQVITHASSSHDIASWDCKHTVKYRICPPIVDLPASTCPMKTMFICSLHKTASQPQTSLASQQQQKYNVTMTIESFTVATLQSMPTSHMSRKQRVKVITLKANYLSSSLARSA